MKEFVRNALKQFGSEIAPFAPGYTSASVALFGNRYGKEIEIVKAVIRLDPLDATEDLSEIKVGKFVAARFRVDDYAAFLSALLDKQGALVKSPIGLVSFAFNDNRSAEMKAFDERGLQSYSRFTTLAVDGTNHLPRPQPNLDWALRALPSPFSDIGDLGREYGFGELPEHPSARLEVEAHNLAVIDGSSTVEGNIAKIVVRLALPLFPNNIKVGVVVIQNAKAVRRTQLLGSDMNFQVAEDQRGVLVGHAKLEVPEDALLHCFVSYNDAPLHALYVHEPSTVPNPLRTALETFDPQLTHIRRGLGLTPAARVKDKKLADDLEHAVGAVLFMLGFTSYRLGMETMTDGPDLLMRSGNRFALIECSSQTFPGEKRHKLLRRASEVRERLRHSWLSNPEVLPVIVTSETRDVAFPSIPEANREGIAVLTADDMALIIENTLLPPNPDALMDQLFRSLETVTTK